MSEQKPTAASVDRLHTNLLGVWKKTHQKWKEIDSFYNLTFSLWDRDTDRPEYHSPRARSIIDSAVDNQLSGSPKPKRLHSGRSEARAQRADRIEPWISAVFDETSVIEIQPTWKTAAKHMMLYGYTIIEQAVTIADEPEAPERGEYETDEEFEHALNVYKNHKLSWMPFRIRAPHPSKVLLDPVGKNPRYSIKTMSRYAIDLEELTQERFNEGSAESVFKAGDNPYEKINCLEYTSDRWHALLVLAGTGQQSKMLFVEENDWGFVPFSHAFSGFGSEQTNVDFDPSQVAVGMLDHLLDALLVQSQALSGRHNALLEASFQIWGTTKNAMEIAEHLRRGDIVPGIRQQDLFKVASPNLPGWMFKAESEIDADIEEATFSRQLSGIREEGVSTVGQQAILSTAASRKFVMPQRQMEHLATQTAERILRLLDQVVEEEVTVQGHTIGPKDLDHDYSVKVAFNVVDPVLQLQKKQQGMDEVSRGLKSKETYWANDAELEDATGEKKRILKEQVESSPEVVQYLAAEVAREFGLSEVLERARALQAQQSQAQTSGLVGPDGRPIQSTMGTGSEGSLPAPLTGDTPGVPQLPNTAASALGGEDLLG